MTERVFIVASARLPIGKNGGQFCQVPPAELGAVLVDHLLETVKFNGKEIDELIVGNILSGGGNLARRIGLLSQLPVTTPAFTVDRQCASGVEALTLGLAKIKSGLSSVVICGGVESTSRAPWQIEKPTALYRGVPNILARHELAAGAYGDPDMGPATEELAKKMGISRLEQDAYALSSQQKYYHAYQAGHFRTELVSFGAIAQDESPRFATTAETLAQLPAVFSEGGTLTAGNSSPLNDGAGLAILASATYCREHHLTPTFELIDSLSVGIDPHQFGLGPVVAIEQLLQRNHLTQAQIDCFELNEAFSGQVLACLKISGIPAERVNRSGGALAFGHPFGATGAILVRRLMSELSRCQGEYGIVSLCVGGGQGAALLVRRLS